MAEQRNLKHKIGEGISPNEFMAGMQTLTMELSDIPNTKEQFYRNYEEFHWNHESDQRFFAGAARNSGMHCLILCTDWCPDVIWNVPVLFRVMEQVGIPTEVLLMEEHQETMDLFLVDGGRPQPIAVLLDKSGNVVGQWGARPGYIQSLMDKFRRNHPDRQSPNYQAAISDVYREIGQLYHDVDRYQDAMIAELRALFTDVVS